MHCPRRRGRKGRAESGTVIATKQDAQNRREPRQKRNRSDPEQHLGIRGPCKSVEFKDVALDLEVSGMVCPLPDVWHRWSHPCTVVGGVLHNIPDPTPAIPRECTHNQRKQESHGVLPDH